MAAFTQDFDLLVAILRSNAVENSVDPGMLRALLEAYASSERRVDLVLLRIQWMLGRELIHTGAQQEMRDEIHNVDDIRIEYEHLIPTPTRRQEQEHDVLILPMAQANDPHTLLAGNGPNQRWWNDIQSVDDEIRIAYEQLVPRPAHHRQEEPDVRVLSTTQPNPPSALSTGNVHNNNWWDGIQRVDNDISIEYEHLIPRPAQRQEDPDVLVLPTVQPNDPPVLTARYGTDQTTSVNVGPAKRTIADRDAATGVQVSSTVVVNSVSASTSNSQINQQRQIIQPNRTINSNPIIAPLIHIPVGNPNLPAAGPASTDPIGNLIRCFSVPQAQENSVAALVKTPETSYQNLVIKESNETSPTPKEREEMAVKFFKILAGAGRVLHVKFAAYKAAEFATLKNSTHHLDEFIQSLCYQPAQIVNSKQYWDPPEKENSENKVVKANRDWDPPETENAEHQRLFQHVYEEFIKDQLDFFVTTLPDADPEFLEVEIRGSNGDQERIQSLLTQFFEGEKTYPSRADYNKRKEYDKLAHTFFTVEEFLDLYGDPFKHFGDETRATDRNYRDEALNQLKLDFRRAGSLTLRKLLIKHSYHYWPTYQEVSKSTLISQERKTKRSLREFKKFKAQNIFLIQEIAFIRKQAEVETYMINKEQMRLDAVAIARQNNALFECPICCEEELVELDMTTCPSGHGTCRNCVRRHAEELIGVMKNHVPCLDPQCETEYALDVLKEALGKPTFNRLEARLQAEEIIAAGIEGLESCPFCDFAHVPRDTDKLFECQNPKCQKVSCRTCREVYHAPIPCEEAVKQRFSNYVEAKMTEALVRECPSCKIKFVKSEGCNRMTCVKCQTVMCYVCRKQIRSNESHFDDRQPNPEGKCPQHSDTDKMHDEEVAKSAEQAKAELAKSNPNIRVDLVLASGSREDPDGWMDELLDILDEIS